MHNLSSLLWGASLLILCACSNPNEKESTESNSSPSTKIGKAIAEIPDFNKDDKHQVMVLGSFHFNRNNDGSDVVAKNQIDVTSKISQQQIEELVTTISKEYKPTIIAVEWKPRFQTKFDSLLQEYKNGNWELGKNEAFQIGFRLAKKLNLPNVYCIDNRPPQPESLNRIDDWEEYADSLNQSALFYEYDDDNLAFNQYMDEMLSQLSLLDYLKLVNSPEHLKRYKALSFTGLVNLGHQDTYVGADLTGNWYRRNTRIFVNARNLCKSNEERVLVIYGAGHKWALDEIFDGSPEFKLVQPFDY